MRLSARSLAVPACLALLSVGTRSAGAQAACAAISGNVVQNCGFESTYYYAALPYAATEPTGWTLTANNGGNYAASSYVPHSGVYGYGFGDFSPSSSTLSQSLITTPGSLYQISFWALNDYGTSLDDLLTVSFGGVQVFSASPTNRTFQQFTFTGRATGASTTLAFTGQSNVGLIFMDDVSVTPLATTAPEPGTWMLLGTGLLGLGGVARRRRMV